MSPSTARNIWLKEDMETRLHLKDLKPAMKLEGRVTKTDLAGAFVDVGAECDGLIHISKLKEGSVYRILHSFSIFVRKYLRPFPTIK